MLTLLLALLDFGGSILVSLGSREPASFHAPPNTSVQTQAPREFSISCLPVLPRERFRYTHLAQPPSLDPEITKPKFW